MSSILFKSLDYICSELLQTQRNQRIRSRTNQMKKTKQLRTITKRDSKRCKPIPAKTWISGLESYVHRVAEETFGVKFIKTRNLPWLKSPMTGKSLELDLYNDDFKLAIEIQGRQHR